jgi:pimeloyl-ACP methyl ester carboxylesterase
MFDASPSARPGAEADPDNSVTRVLSLMERLPKAWAKREDFVAAITAEGHAESLAQWLAMNLVADSAGGYVLRLDLHALRTMLHDYYKQDLWHVAFDGSLPGELHVVIAERSSTLDEDDRARLAAAPPHVHVHRIDAGHWLHIEAPANVVDLLTLGLPTPLR